MDDFGNSISSYGAFDSGRVRKLAYFFSGWTGGANVSVGDNSI